MSEKNNSNVSKLLRVLVAGGVALAGVAGTRADDRGTTPSSESEKAKEKEKDLQKAKAEQAEKEKKNEQKKADDEKKAAQSDGGGVKGW